MMWLPLLVTIVATAEVKGTPEPCGCNSDPLGDVARVATLATGGLWLDAGSLLYDPEAMSVDRRPQADATAAQLAKIYRTVEVGLGAGDLPRGAAHVGPPRQACNVTGVPTAAPHVRVVDGVRIGVFGVVEPARLAGAAGVSATPAAVAAKAAIATLRKEHAQVVVALCGMSRTETRALVKAVPGIDFAIVGAEVGDGMSEPEPASGGFIVAPADLARYAAKLTLEVHGAGKLQAFAGEPGRKRQLDRTDKRVVDLKTQLAAFAKDATADKTFVAARQAELDGLVAERTKLASQKLTPPTGSWFTYELTPINHKIARDPAIAAQLKTLAHDIGQANLAAAKGQAAPPAEAGQPSYVGDRECARCHKSQVDFWKHTVHAQAWKTLVDVDKQYNYDCIGCHVTGWQKPGGVNLATVEARNLTNVQCETCHGPGSKHVDESGMESPHTMTRRPADRFCADNCHTREHSDTFTLVPYLRDILGKGHGAAARAKLGAGPTGHEIRQKALEAAAH